MSNLSRWQLIPVRRAIHTLGGRVIRALDQKIEKLVPTVIFLVIFFYRSFDEIDDISSRSSGIVPIVVCYALVGDYVILYSMMILYFRDSKHTTTFLY
jgi:hypothetical protein